MGESQKDRRLSMENVTIKDIAGACGVSYATVSRTLNRRSGVHPATREKILRVADRLGYSPNLHARSLNAAALNGARFPSASPAISSAGSTRQNSFSSASIIMRRSSSSSCQIFFASCPATAFLLLFPAE